MNIIIDMQTLQEKIEAYKAAYLISSSLRKSNYAKRAAKFGLTIQDIESVHKKQGTAIHKIEDVKKRSIANDFYLGRISYQEMIKSLSECSKIASNPILESDDYNWIFIGDLHEPYSDDRYFDFINEAVIKYGINKIVFLGDEIESPARSYHDQDPDGDSAGRSLALAKSRLKRWYNAFPDAVVTEGNHSKLAFRKAFTGGIPSEWLKTMQEVLGVPNWEYVSELETTKFIVGHGDDGKISPMKILKKNNSYIQGHYHTASSLNYYGQNYFGMQVGCGVDINAHPFKFMGKGVKSMIHSAGIYVDGRPQLIFPKYIK